MCVVLLVYYGIYGVCVVLRVLTRALLLFFGSRSLSFVFVSSSRFAIYLLRVLVAKRAPTARHRYVPFRRSWRRLGRAILFAVFLFPLERLPAFRTAISLSSRARRVFDSAFGTIWESDHRKAIVRRLEVSRATIVSRRCAPIFLFLGDPSPPPPPPPRSRCGRCIDVGLRRMSTQWRPTPPFFSYMIDDRWQGEFYLLAVISNLEDEYVPICVWRIWGHHWRATDMDSSGVHRNRTCVNDSSGHGLRFWGNTRPAKP